MGDLRASCNRDFDVVMMGEEVDEGVRLVKVEEDGGALQTNGGESGALRLDECVPKTVVRVLLVEADDSTRQIITALLRKCNYKVAAVGDGLKAWEILRRRHNNIDLVLTEVDLPSISGYALLTLIMEHDGCKKIPVIMMSSCDSMSMSFRCVAKGAADFLIKPLRKNELKNLWQHVWRRVSLTTYDHEQQNNPADPCRVEATSIMKEARDDQSGDNLSSSQKNSLSAAQTNDAQDFSWSLMKQADQSVSGHNNLDRPEVAVERGYDGDAINQTESFKAAAGSFTDGKMDQYTRSGGCEARDLIAKIDSQPEFITSSDQYQFCSDDKSNGGSIIDLELELTLTRSEDRDEHGSDAYKRSLNHSNESAISWFGSNKKLKTSYPSSDSTSSTKIRGESRGGFSSQLTSSEDGCAFPISRKFPGISSKEGSEEPAQVVNPPTDFDLPHFGFGPKLGSNCTQRCHTPESPAEHVKESSSFLTSPSLQSDRCSMMGNYELNESRNHQHKDIAMSEASEKPQKPGIDSNNPGSRDALCSASVDGWWNKSSTTSVEDELVNDNTTCNDVYAHDDDQLLRKKAYREAALAKFRQKRKDRCFEKKVRYQSRKRLAEMRPRVKGQFVCKG